MSTRYFHRMRDSMAEVFARIDDNGGWPIDKPFYTMLHECQEERTCTFTETRMRDEYHTTLFDEDDYFWWKLSGERKQKIKAENYRGFIRQVSRIQPE
jgi:hypothetical protein